MARIVPKNNRIDLRVKAEQKELLSYAAALQDLNLSAFIMSSALKEAQEVIAEKVYFSLSDSKWNAFCDKLDQPAKTIPKLKKLFMQPDIFNE